MQIREYIKVFILLLFIIVLFLVSTFILKDAPDKPNKKASKYKYVSPQRILVEKEPNRYIYQITIETSGLTNQSYFSTFVSREDLIKLEKRIENILRVRNKRK